MLNELYHLSCVLERASIKPFNWHDDLIELPNASVRKPCYRLFINSDFHISDIEPMKKESMASLRKWEPSNGNSFPSFNIQPLYRLADEDKKKRLKKWREGTEAVDLGLLREWCADESTKNWDDKFGKKMDKCLRVIPQELQKKCFNIPSDFSALKDLFERITKLGKGHSTEFFYSLNSCIWRLLDKNSKDLFLFPILIHEGSSNKKPEDDRGAVSVFLDVPDWKEYPVAHGETIKLINTYLLNSASTTSQKDGENRGPDAFGLTSAGTKGKLAEVKLPILGGVTLRAMNSESPCQYRYGTIDERSFMIGKDSRKRVKGALEWLRDKKREGETWGRIDGRELLFSYPGVVPKTQLKLAACFGAGKTDDTEARFENYAKNVVDCLKGLAPSLKDIELCVFSLRKMDKARTKVVFHRNYSALRLSKAAQEWQQGCANIPPIQMKAWGEEKGKAIFVEPEVPFPLQIAACINRVWKLDGTSQSEIKSIPNTSGIELLLDESAVRRQVPHLLTMAFQNSMGLFISMGNMQHRNGPGDVLTLNGINKHKQLMPSILGLLLWKMGIGKESYMDNPPYLVGRLLKVADELHAVYCKEVRKNNLPPQLLGNALMAAALDSPTQALAQLALRIAPYYGWARTNTTASAGLSRYFLKEFSLIEKKLRDTVMPARLEDAERAQLLLGYISGNPQTEEPIKN